MSFAGSYKKRKNMNDFEENNNNEILTPPELREIVNEIQDDLLPAISKEKYNNKYLAFKSWTESKNVKTITENVMIPYFMELAEKYKPPTLWATYSMLKSTLKNNDNVNIAKFLKLTTFLKRKSEGYKSKKSKILSPENINTFLSEAPDEIYLATKVALIFGINGACRREELSNIKMEDVQHEGNLLLIQIPNTKTKVPRSFTVDGEFRDIVLKYEALRPKKTDCSRFFLKLQKGKCVNQVIGKNKFGKMPSEIATYLKLENPELYTGHSFRRTSVTLLADSGADLITLKRHGGWKSSTVAEGYIDNSTNYKRKIGNQIEAAINLPSSSGTQICKETAKASLKDQIPNKKKKIVHQIETAANSDLLRTSNTVQETNEIPQTIENNYSSQISSSQELNNQSITYNITNCTVKIYN
ncbi:uncharacterized protein LOC127280650 [Leptopilina boulardi]|uniref:uncharacterized protein LOC127280650 n=1 Tax=Leptopilina boulardi TaxID=63433 RepID=UPI0021F68356|nr:uncharacterized protein LOC127280650 [Leptopilina boulardi]